MDQQLLRQLSSLSVIFLLLGAFLFIFPILDVLGVIGDRHPPSSIEGVWVFGVPILFFLSMILCLVILYADEASERFARARKIVLSLLILPAGVISLLLLVASLFGVISDPTEGIFWWYLLFCIAFTMLVGWMGMLTWRFSSVWSTAKKKAHLALGALLSAVISGALFFLVGLLSLDGSLS